MELVGVLREVECVGVLGGRAEGGGGRVWGLLGD